MTGQQVALPSFRSPQIWYLPLLIDVNSTSLGVGLTSPRQTRLPSARNPQVNPSPALTAANGGIGVVVGVGVSVGVGSGRDRGRRSWCEGCCGCWGVSCRWRRCYRRSRRQCGRGRWLRSKRGLRRPSRLRRKRGRGCPGWIRRGYRGQRRCWRVTICDLASQCGQPALKLRDRYGKADVGDWPAAIGLFYPGRVDAYHLAVKVLTSGPPLLPGFIATHRSATVEPRSTVLVEEMMPRVTVRLVPIVSAMGKPSASTSSPIRTLSGVSHRDSA